MPEVLQAGCLSCHPTNSIKALKAHNNNNNNNNTHTHTHNHLKAFCPGLVLGCHLSVNKISCYSSNQGGSQEEHIS